MAGASPAELVFVVDVTELTKNGFVGSSSYEGKKVEIEFDEAGAGVFLTSEMAGRLHVRRGSALSVTLEDDTPRVVELKVSGVGGAARISDSRVYYGVGRDGGSVVRIRKA